MKQFKMNERQRFSIRKFSIGAASVLLGSVFFVANPATEVQAAETSTEVVAQDGDVKPDNSSALSTLDPNSQNPNVGQAGTETEAQGAEKKEPGTLSKDGEGEAKVEETSTEGNSKLELNKEIAEKQDQPKTDIELSRQLNTQNLESLLTEIDAIKTENYTEESVAALKAKVEEARQVLATAQTQTEIDAAFRTLVSYKNTGLKRVKKNVEPKAPKLDTTNGKATVGLKTENTEPNGTNIAGHNHSLAGTSLPEGSGFRTEDTNGLSIEVEGNLNFKSGQQLGVYDTYIHLKLKYDKTRYGERPSFSITNTPNTGPHFEISNPRRDGKSYYNTQDGYLSGYLTGVVPNSMIGKYNMLIHARYNATGVTTTLKFPIEVKPPVPTLETPQANDGSKYLTLTASTLSGNHSEVQFEVNGNVSNWIKAENGKANYDNGGQGFRPGDKVRVRSKAYSDEIVDNAGQYRELIHPEESESDWSSATGRETVLPAFPTPKLDKTGATKEVNDAFTTKSGQIDNDNGLTNEEKSEVKGLAETAKNNAITKINEAQTETDLNKAKTEGISNIQNVALTGTTKKAEAIEAINQHLSTKNSQVEGSKELTTEEKTAIKDKMSAEATTAINNINADSTNTNQLVENAKQAGIGAIDTASALPAKTKKAEAIEAINAAAFAKKTEISNRFDLATEDKSRALQQVDQEAKNAKSAVDKGVTNKDVEQAKVAGIDAINNINPQPTPRPLPTPQPQPSTPTQPDQGATETPTSPSEPAPQPSQPTTPSQPASPAPSQSSAPTQAPRVAASPSVSSTSTQAPAQEQVDKSELGALTQELDQRLKALATVSDPKIDAAKAVLLDAQKALEDSALTEQGLRTAVESVKAALNSLKDVQANASDSKPAQDKSDVKKVAEDSKDSDKMSETYSVPTGVFVAGLLALLGVIIFWLIRRKKDSELKQLSIELTKVLEQQDVAKADKKVLAKAQKLLQETLDFVKEESGSAETEAKLVEELKAILDKLK